MSSTANAPLTQCGVILLPGVTLLPNNVIPLHIFENRYRRMLCDALEQEKQFAIGNLISEETSDLLKCVAPVGVLGSIKASKELEDGRSVLMIEGTETVRFTEWLDENIYPTAKILPLDKVTLEDESDAKKLILDALQVHLESVPCDVRDDVEATLAEIPNLTELIDFVAHHFISHDPTRQFYLSERSDSVRASKLLLTLGEDT